MPQPLPANQYNINTHPREHNAYAKCVAYESNTLAGLHPVPPGVSPLVCARLLGYMILYAPTDIGRENISNEVMSCPNEEYLADMAKLYIQIFLRCFKSAKGPTPAPASHPSRPSFDNVTDTFIHMLLEAPQDHRKAKTLALIRDGYRCVISGRTDTNVYDTNAEIRAAWDAAVLLNPEMRLSATTCAHIFPESINHNIGGENEGTHKHQYAASVWAVMERFGQVLGVEELNGADIHRLENIMTMDGTVHTLFDSLGIWLEETPTPHQYNVRGRYPAYTLGIQNPITLPTYHYLPPPDPRYLRLHAACAQVAHLSGAGEYINNILRDMETTRVLAKDGSSADLLNFRLFDARVF